MRTDNDTWDITSSVGATALFVAASRALEANKPDPLVVDPYAEIFCRAVGGEWADVLDGKAPENKLMSEFGGHFVNYQAARTKYFDDFFYAAADAGARQIVIPAAGLDSRAYRLAWPEGTVVFELDQPQVLEFKRDVLTRSGEAPTAQRREIAVDLRDDWPAALRGSGFDPSRPSAWLVEGLLVYLPAAAQRELFTGIDDLAAPGSHVAVDDGKPFSDELYEQAREAEQESQDGARFFSLIYNEQHAPAIDWFTDHGWQGAAVDLGEYCRQVDRPVPGPDSEAGPMFASISLVSARRPK
jgi:methyltransferase (TIGR00027 family)